MNHRRRDLGSSLYGLVLKRRGLNGDNFIAEALPDGVEYWRGLGNYSIARSSPRRFIGLLAGSLN